MPGATSSLLTVPRALLAAPEAAQGRFLHVGGSMYELAANDSRETADVGGMVWSAAPTGLIIVQPGSFVPLRSLGTLAELNALSSGHGYLVGSRFGDEPTSGWTARLFTLPKPPKALTEADMGTLYAFLELSAPYQVGSDLLLRPAPVPTPAPTPPLPAPTPAPTPAPAPNPPDSN